MPTNPDLRKLLGEAFTSRPWRVDPDERVGGASQIIHEAHGRIATTVAFMSTGRHNPREEDDADAALIVAAVNNFESHLDQIESLQRKLVEIERHAKSAAARQLVLTHPSVYPGDILAIINKE